MDPGKYELSIASRSEPTPSYHRSVPQISREYMIYLTNLSREFRAEFDADWPSVGVGLEEARPVIRVVVRTAQDLARLPQSYHDVPVRAKLGRPGIHAVGSAP
jgi:hypothetical protein